jgi:hypothetical protein
MIVVPIPITEIRCVKVPHNFTSVVPFISLHLLFLLLRLHLSFLLLRLHLSFLLLSLHLLFLSARI